MAYINKKEYQKLLDYAPQGVDKNSITQALISRGHKIQGMNDQEQKSFGGQLIKDIANPFVRGASILQQGATATGGLLKATGQRLIGKDEKAKETLQRTATKLEDRSKQQIGSIFGNYNPVTSMKEVAGTALEGFSTLYGGGAAKSVAQAGLKGALKSAVKTGVKSGLVGGAGFGFGRGLGDDETVGKSLKQGAISGVAGAVGGGVLGGVMFGGSLATKSLVKKVSQKLQPVAEQTKQKVTDYIGKAIRPKVAGLSSNQMKGLQRKQVEGFQVLKNNVKDIKLPDEYGGLISRTPKTVGEVVSAVQDVKTKLFSRWDKLAREAGDKGASFNPVKTIGEMTKFTKDKSYSPSLRKYANEILEEVSELKGESPLVIQSRIKELNESLAGYFAGRVEKGRARIDASVAKLLNEELDDVIFNFTAGDYKALRSQFSALKSIEKDATRTAQRMLNRQKKGLGDLTDIFTGGDLISGILTANPASVSRGLIGKGIQLAYKALNDPDRYIRKIFNELGETTQPQRLINRGLPVNSGKISPTDAIPLPKGKGEILKSTQKLDSLNPTGSVFSKYTPKQRATAELADNITTLDKTIGKSADEMITIYRGTSKGDKIVPGDFITTNKQLAKDYAGTGKVLEKRVKLSDILDDITEPLGEEYIYRPKSNPLKSNLINEAKKYKSAEDYVKGKGIIDESVNNINLKMNDGNTISFNKTSRVVNHSKGRVIQEIEGTTKDGKFIGARFLVNEENKTLTIIGFSSESKGKGYGTQLLNNIKEEARKNGITKIVANDTRTTQSLKYWEKQGFKPNGEINAVLEIKPTTKSQLISEWNKANGKTPLKKTVNTLEQEAKKITIVNKKPITVYRGEGKGIGNSTLVNGRYFADSEKFASNFGKVSKDTIPANSKIFNLDLVKDGNSIIPKEMLVDPEKLTKYLIDKGYDATRNTNTRGVEYVLLNKQENELLSLALKSKDKVDFNTKLLANWDKYRDEINRTMSGKKGYNFAGGESFADIMWKKAQKLK